MGRSFFFKVLHKLNTRSSDWNENAEVAAQNFEEHTRAEDVGKLNPTTQGSITIVTQWT